MLGASTARRVVPGERQHVQTARLPRPQQRPAAGPVLSVAAPRRWGLVTSSRPVALAVRATRSRGGWAAVGAARRLCPARPTPRRCWAGPPDYGGDGVQL